jgi:hypothetical protein
MILEGEDYKILPLSPTLTSHVKSEEQAMEFVMMIDRNLLGGGFDLIPCCFYGFANFVSRDALRVFELNLPFV